MWGTARTQRRRAWLLLRRHSSGAAMEPLTMRMPTMAVWGANTGVGKTLFSAGLAAACERAKVPLLYLKPVQTGFPADSDSRLVAAAARGVLEHGPHAAALLPPEQRSAESGGLDSAGQPVWWLTMRTLYAWGQPVSPHLAVQREGRPVPDSEIVAALPTHINRFAGHIWPPGRPVSRPIPGALALVETAGGPASPGPSGTLQCDLLRPLRLPGILVGDGRLGGISASLSALDTLRMRGYSVPLVLLMDHGLGNAEALQHQLAGSGSEVVAFPVCQPPPAQQAQQGPLDANLLAWLEECAGRFDSVLDSLLEAHQQRQAKLKVAAHEARQVLWWPFTQHCSVAGDDMVTVIDGRAGESFAVWQPQQGAVGGWRGSEMQLQYDACASWWTQGVSAAAQPRLVQALGHTAGRYGHVMFPENVHEPALELAKRLLGTVGAGWASRVFYTDDGSTAVEVALKMAFRKFMSDQGLLEEGGPELQVVGLTEAYHGDTLGAMDAVPPSPYNGRRQTPWYRPRGLFLDPPTVALVGGEWAVRLPPGLTAAEAAPTGSSGQSAQHAEHGSTAMEAFPSQQDLFSPAREASPIAKQYRQYIAAQLAQHTQRAPGTALGACILEPVLQGAGGMRFVDPLFQRLLVAACREQGMPVIFDEVFTGCWRLGAPSAAALLGVQPDIACYAKLLTGGLVPLSATLASEGVFKAFQGDSKLHALLHGHSYTAHPVGCGTALEALRLYEDAALNPNLCTPDPGAAGERCTRGCEAPCGRLLSVWDEDAARELSSHPNVQGVVVLGTVLAVELKSKQGGYASDAAAAVTAALRTSGSVYCRPLGNVVYLMVTPMTERGQCDALLGALREALG